MPLNQCTRVTVDKISRYQLVIGADVVSYNLTDTSHALS